MRDLRSEWIDNEARTAVRAKSMMSVAEKTTACLESKTQIESDGPIPTAVYLSNLDLALSSAETEDEFDRLNQKATAAYLECTPEYFDELTALLAPKKAAAIERNRELLTAFAQRMVQYGYTP